jgi:hypothetical protein
MEKEKPRLAHSLNLDARPRVVFRVHRWQQSARRSSIMRTTVQYRHSTNGWSHLCSQRDGYAGLVFDNVVVVVAGLQPKDKLVVECGSLDECIHRLDGGRRQHSVTCW